MTLVVGRIENEKIKFISDSKVTDQNSVRNNVLSGNLKSWILTPSLCVSFAGNTFYAEKFLSDYYDKKIKTVQDLLLYLLKLNNESNDETDFCVGTLFNNAPKLYKISGRRIEDNLKTIWIGDRIAFNKYQETYHETESDNPFDKMEKAFSVVVNDGTIDTVSDFQISSVTVYHEGLQSLMFIYDFKTMMNFAPGTITLDSNNPRAHIPFGGPEEGGFGNSYLRSINVHTAGIAIHFPQGKFGVLFCPALNQNKAIIIKNEDGEDFANEVFKKYGIALEGLVAKDGFVLK